MKIVITGTSTGIGQALAKHLLAGGHGVWGIARSDQRDLATRYKDSFHASRCDVSDWEAVERVAVEIAAAWASIDGLVTCAGIQGEAGRALTAHPASWHATVHANLGGTFNTVRAFHRLLAQGSHRAKIVCFSGGGATKPRTRFSAYGVAKTAIVRLVETIAEEEKGGAIDINAVAPGAINTRLTDEVISLGPSVAGEIEYQAALKQKAGGGGSIENVIQLVQWLLSPASDGISGRLISAQWDDWKEIEKQKAEISRSDLYTLRRLVPPGK